MPLGSTSASRLSNLRRRDSECWRELTDRLNPWIIEKCRRIGLDDATANDVAQDVATSMLVGIADFRWSEHSGNFRGWIGTITWRSILNVFRSGRRERQLLRQVAERLRAIGGKDWSESLMKATVNYILNEVQPCFEPKTWQAFRGRCLEGKSTQEVCSELAMTPNAVYVAVSKVRGLVEDFLRRNGI